MSKGKRVRFAQDVADREWSIKVLRDVIFPEIYEMYGPNAEPQYQLPATVIEELRRQVYSDEQKGGIIAEESVKSKVPQNKKKKGIKKAASNDDANQQGRVYKGA